MKDAIRGLHNNTFWEKVKAFPVGWQAWGVTHFQTFRRTITKIVRGWEAKGGMGEGSLLTPSTLAEHCPATICISASLSPRMTLL